MGDLFFFLAAFLGTLGFFFGFGAAAAFSDSEANPTAVWDLSSFELAGISDPFLNVILESLGA